MLRIPKALLAITLAVTALGCERPLADLSRPSAGAVQEIRARLEAAPGAAAANATEVSAGEPTGFATVRGTFRVAGSLPAQRPLTVDKDQEICSPGGEAILDESVVVAKDGGLRNVLIYLTTNMPNDDSRWIHESYAASRDAIVEFDQKRCIFLSHVFAARSTNRIKVLNSDPVSHNTNVTANGKARSENFSIPPGGHLIYNPGGAAREPFSATCSIHPWMKSYMFYSDSPYFSVSNADGRFEIAQVPAGVPLEFRVWHEKIGFLQAVNVGGKSEKWTKGRVPVKLESGVDFVLDVTLEASLFAK